MFVPTKMRLKERKKQTSSKYHENVFLNHELIFVTFFSCFFSMYIDVMILFCMRKNIGRHRLGTAGHGLEKPQVQRFLHFTGQLITSAHVFLGGWV